ncbi:MAG: IclR family transcriptional regulator [Actinomyces sp.]|nr:IclR family transcriptional regulator [Actinomyces sp.]MDN6795534.1 IclR family transcriptional regulator [Propionibacterium sp.]
MTPRAQSSDAPRRPLQTVDRALQILMSFSDGRLEWGVSELADSTRWDRSTTQRLLAALASRGFLQVDPVSRRYSLGPAMWRISTVWERSGGLARLAEPFLAELASRTGHTALFTTPDGAHVRCLAAVDGGGGPIRNHPLVGELYPAHAGATSRAYFAFLPPGERHQLLAGRPVARFTDLTSVDEEEVERQFDLAVTRGYALSEGEYDGRTRAIAVPVMVGRRPIGSLTLLEPKVTSTTEELLADLPRLQQAARDLATLLSCPLDTDPEENR